MQGLEEQFLAVAAPVSLADPREPGSRQVDQFAGNRQDRRIGRLRGQTVASHFCV